MGTVTERLPPPLCAAIRQSIAKAIVAFNQKCASPPRAAAAALPRCRARLLICHVQPAPPPLLSRTPSSLLLPTPRLLSAHPLPSAPSHHRRGRGVKARDQGDPDHVRPQPARCRPAPVRGEEVRWTGCPRAPPKVVPLKLAACASGGSGSDSSALGSGRRLAAAPFGVLMHIGFWAWPTGGRARLGARRPWPRKAAATCAGSTHGAGLSCRGVLRL